MKNGVKIVEIAKKMSCICLFFFQFFPNYNNIVTIAIALLFFIISF